MKACAITLVVALFLAVIPGESAAQVVVNRQGDENPAISITKSIFWGGLGGLVLGSAIALAVDDNEGDIIKWSFVGGTFAGLAVGIWHVTNRPEPQGAMLDLTPEGARLAAPSFSFEARPDPLLAGDRVDRSIRAPLVSLRM
jgi:hypothetical protein